MALVLIAGRRIPGKIQRSSGVRHHRHHRLVIAIRTTVVEYGLHGDDYVAFAAALETEGLVARIDQPGEVRFGFGRPVADIGIYILDTPTTWRHSPRSSKSSVAPRARRSRAQRRDGGINRFDDFRSTGLTTRCWRGWTFPPKIHAATTGNAPPDARLTADRSRSWRP